jgi:aminoglycoside 6'-N-acetyltransferase I
MHIREPTETESEQIGRELLLPFYREEERLDPEFNQLDVSEDQDADRWIHADGRGIFVATVEEELIGVVLLGRTESPPIYERGDISFLEGLYVKPAFRRRGIASALLERAEEWATNQQCEYLRTWVHVHNEKAIDLYHQSFSLKYQSFWKPLDT